MSRLTLVPTPIGNLGDVTLRALEVLRTADHLAAEDTRRTRVLLDHYGVDRPLSRLDAHTVASRGPQLLAEHEWLAYLTDAGTPGISDPGAELVALALERGARVEVLPGATALVPALVASGLPTARFTFEGFLPRGGGRRARRLAALAASDATSVIYESPRRLATTLRELAEVCGDERQAAVSREISKLFEETWRGPLAELAERAAAAEVKGEIVITVAGAQQPDEAPAGAPGLTDAAAVAARLARGGVRGRLLREALSALGVARNEAYRLALQYPDSPGALEPDAD